jgi:hypothetical protein
MWPRKGCREVCEVACCYSLAVPLGNAGSGSQPSEDADDVRLSRKVDCQNDAYGHQRLCRRMTKRGLRQAAAAVAAAAAGASCSCHHTSRSGGC